MIFLNNARNYNHEEIHSIKGAIYDRKVDASDYGYRALLKVNKGALLIKSVTPDFR